MDLDSLDFEIVIDELNENDEKIDHAEQMIRRIRDMIDGITTSYSLNGKASWISRR